MVCLAALAYALSMTQFGLWLMPLAFSAALTLAAPQALLEQIPPSRTELETYSGLFAAAIKGDVNEIKRLLAQGANPNMRDENGRTPLHVAGHFGQYDAARALLAGKADVNALDKQRYDLITIAAVRDDAKMIRVALEGGGNPKAITSPYEGTALIAAAHLGHVDVVKTLIEAKAPLDHVNNLGWTALLEAIILGDGGVNHTEVVRLLVAAGAKISLADRGGVTPLEHAKRRGYAQIVAILERK